MGTEIVFVLILPIAGLCLLAAVFLWSRAAKVRCEAVSLSMKDYGPLFAGFTVSMVSLAVLTYLASYAEFTALVHQGFYTEAQRPVYLPRRVVGQAIINLVFLLPTICFVVVPLTVWLIRRERLTFKNIGFFAILGWFVLSFVGWVSSYKVATPLYSFPSFLQSMALPVLLYGLPIPVTALWLFSPKKQA